MNWTAAYQLASKITRSTKLREFQFKLLHRRLPTSDFLTKIQIKEKPPVLFFCKEEKEKLTQVPFLKLPYNKIFLGIRNSAPKGFPGRSKRFFLRHFSSNWFKACFFKVTSTSKFLPSYSQALHLALLKLSFGATLPYTLENLVCITLRVFLLQRMLPLSSLVAFLFFLSFFFLLPISFLLMLKLNDNLFCNDNLVIFILSFFTVSLVAFVIAFFPFCPCV